jgi:hypothetical protein
LAEVLRFPVVSTDEHPMPLVADTFPEGGRFMLGREYREVTACATGAFRHFVFLSAFTKVPTRGLGSYFKQMQRAHPPMTPTR